MEKYCSDCEHFDPACGGGSHGGCDFIHELIRAVGAHVPTSTFSDKGDATNCQGFRPSDDWKARARDEASGPDNLTDSMCGTLHAGAGVAVVGVGS